MNKLPPDQIFSAIDRTMLENLPLWRYEGKILFLNDPHAAKKIIPQLLHCDYLGFDTETRPAFHRGQYYDPSLVQVASEEYVVIFQLSACGGIPTLKEIFEAERVLKVCVGVADDVHHLQKMQPFAARGFVELSAVTEELGVRDRGLRKLCANFLGVRISKKEQTSNWAKFPLTEDQLRYAATDAWVSRKIYEVANILRTKGVRAVD
ncbi:MAG: 3'-5' exonuclease domain-containing protein 2 [Puniceicoccales bacterium]|jgi:ribonuclease D|nr:3'-5' exonuclease domain-containing protein 2 [Puniceicoccales bacterium]